MEVKNCKKCGRIFNYLSGPRICPACREELEAKFQDVKKYIEEHKNASIQQVSEEMEVEITQLNQWVREERLVFSEDSMVTLDCESCGAPIRTGRYCEKCKYELSRGLGSLYKKEDPTKKMERDRAKMRYLDM